MYIIPDEFYEEECYIHIPPGEEEAIYEALKTNNAPVYYDFIRFAKKWNNNGCFVVCYFDHSENMVHLHGDFEDVGDCTIFEPEDLVAWTSSMQDILELLE